MDDPTVIYPNAIQAAFSDLGRAIAKAQLDLLEAGYTEAEAQEHVSLYLASYARMEKWLTNLPREDWMYGKRRFKNKETIKFKDED